jgi:membrane associated rhomboid family serine protease
MKNVRLIIISFILIWIVYLINSQISIDLNIYGIIPRNKIGLRGILFAPFLHGSIFHILSNSLPFLVLGTTLFLYYKKTASTVYLFSIIITGSLVWLFARPAIHIGMSGIIYAFATYLVLAGIYSRKFWGVIISILVVALYGGLVWGVFPTDTHTSWEGHLAGSIVGVFLAYVQRKKLRKK